MKRDKIPPHSGFYKTTKELIERVELLKGQTVTNLLGAKDYDKGKGAIGQIIEREGFGVANNSDANPDFKNLGIELKVLPLKTAAKGLSVKERTKVCSINYNGLINEKWISSHAKNKLQKILFVFYYYDKSIPVNSKILDYLLFELENSSEPLIKEDWERTKDLVKEGKAHLLSESQNVILAASRSGAGKLPESQWPDQPNKKYSAKAKQRAFSLKPSFTKTLWIEVQDKNALDSIQDKFHYNSYKELEGVILGKLNKWEGTTLDVFAKKNKLEPKLSKNRNSDILRTALGFTGKKKDIKEIVQ